MAAMLDFSRRSRSPLAQWWWTVDKIIVAHILLLSIIGCALCLAATPTLALRLNLPLYYFAMRHALFLLPCYMLMLGLSLFSPRRIRKIALFLFVAAFLGCALCLVLGPVIKGSHRWLYILGFTIQPSEFIKPAFVILISYMLARQSGWVRYVAPLSLYVLVIGVLLLQPDFGQAMLLTSTLFMLFFVGGAPLSLLTLFFTISGLLVWICYLLLPHVARRIDSFFSPKDFDTYQIDKAIQAFSLGGLFGQGPGEGVVKKILPDAHTDFIFSVAVEEYGGIVAITLILFFCILICRCFMHALREEQAFLRIAISGLTCLVATQTCINLGVNIRLIPTKGMTLPLISYGGSSMIAISITLGMILALTRKDAGLYLVRRKA